MVHAKNKLPNWLKRFCMNPLSKLWIRPWSSKAADIFGENFDRKAYKLLMELLHSEKGKMTETEEDYIHQISKKANLDLAQYAKKYGCDYSHLLHEDKVTTKLLAQYEAIEMEEMNGEKGEEQNEKMELQIGEAANKSTSGVLEDRILTLIKETQGMNHHLHKMTEDLNYLAFSKIYKKIDVGSLAVDEMKQLAVILNRITGIILSAINLGFAIYCFITILL